MKLESILVGVDFSDTSQLAVEHAASLARKADAKLVLLHVSTIPNTTMVLPDAVQPTYSTYHRILQDHLAADRQRLEDLREHIARQDTRVSHMVIDGFADEGVLRAADEVDADLVVLGSHGRTGLTRLLIGSVAEKVVRLSKRNVLVVRPGPETAAGAYRKLLVATDLSASAEHALATAVSLAAPDARIDVLHAWHLPPLSFARGPVPGVAAELAEPIVAHIRERGAALIARHSRPGVELRFDVVEAAPARGILDRLDQEDYDLVVTGSHGRQGLRRFLLGSVAETTVRHAPVPVLVVHGTPEEGLAPGESSP